VMRYASWGMSEMIHYWGSRRHSPWCFCFTSSLGMCWEPAMHWHLLQKSIRKFSINKIWVNLRCFSPYKI
jgi:hypothetical protein